MAKSVEHSKIVYPPGCKELSDELGKDDLIRRLKELARVFQELGQDENDIYAPLALHLATEQYMEHQNKDVRLLTACCLADVFRIFAPEAPFKDTDMIKEIFIFFTTQLRGLEDPDAPSFKRYFYLLENLAWVKSFNICLELEENQEIFIELFKLFFSIINDNHTSKIKTFMLDIMSPLISEADTVSPDLIEIILLNMIDPRKTQKKIAYIMAKELIKRTSLVIEPYVQAYFNNMIMLGKSSESEVAPYIYDLIYELNQVAPSLLLSVIPQLEFKLKSNEESERKSVTKLLAKMFSEKDSDLATQNRPLWICFLGRFNDISVTIRTACIQQTANFILNHPELVKDILEQIKVRQHDPEESVRYDVVTNLLLVAKKDTKALTAEMLQFVKERTLDKKFKVRREALQGLGALYKQTVIDKEVPDKDLEEKLEFVKNKVFHQYYQSTLEDRLLVERLVNIYLVPYQKPVNERMNRLLQLYSTLDENAIKAFSEMLKHRNNVRQIVAQLVDAHERAGEPNPPPISPKLIQLGRTLPENLKPHEYLKKLNLLLKNDSRLRVLLKTLVGPSCTCKKADEIVREILKKISCVPSMPSFLYQLVKSLLERIAPVMVDALAIDHLVLAVSELQSGMEHMSSIADGADQKGVRLLFTLSHYFPQYFKSVEIFENFLSFLKNDDDVISDLSIQILTNTASHLSIDHPEVYSALVPLLVNLAKLGSPKQAKHAVRCITTICINKEQAVTSVFEHIQNSLDPENANFLTAVVSLGHIAQLFPDLFASQVKSIVTKTIVKEILMVDETEGTPTDDPWVPDHAVSEETQAKIQCMKLLVRWLLGLKSNTSNSGTSTLRLLYTVIIHDGDLMENRKTNKPELARLRLQAGCCMLKLAEEPCYSDIVTREQFQALAMLLNDINFQVRFRFANRLQKGLISLKLPLEYMSILCLGVNDPLKERRVQLKNFLLLNIQKRRDYIKHTPSARGRMFYLLPDYVIPYTIHLLAHDPDFKSYKDIDCLKGMKECLWFLLDPLTAKHEQYNYAFLRRMIEDIKQTKDAQCPDDETANKKMYAVCDIALGLLMSKAGNITLKEISEEPVLPGKLFTSPDTQYSNIQSYLPKDFPFEPKRRMATSLSSMTNDLRKTGHANPTTTEIVVLSHAPVVNPLPRTPLNMRSPTGQKRKLQQKTKQDMSEDSEDPEFHPSKAQKKRKVGRPRKSAEEKPTAKSKDENEENNETEEEEKEKEEKEEEEAEPVSKRPRRPASKQTKLEDFSTVKSAKTTSSNSGSASKKVVKAHQKKLAQSLQNKSEASPKTKSKEDDKTPTKKKKTVEEVASPAVVKRLKPPTLREDFSTRPLSPVKRSPSSSPASQTSSRSSSQVTRSTLQSSEESSPAPLPPKKALTRNVPTRSTGRRGGVIANGTNGTSDGLSDATSLSTTQEDDDSITVKRKVRARRK